MGDVREQYEIWANLNIGGVCESVGEVLDSINRDMKVFGFEEELQLRTDVCLASFSTGRQLRPSEVEQIRSELEQGLAAEHTAASLRLSIRHVGQLQESVG